MFRRSLSLSMFAAVFPVAVFAQAPPVNARWPVTPKPLDEAHEIALAMSAAPAEISERADIYVLRNTGFVKVRAGTNECACLVARDYHEASRYPICFDQITATTWLRREMKEGALRAQGVPEPEVQRQVEAAYTTGELSWPSRPGVAYMMSRQQVLFSSPDATGVSAGSWWPHIMLILPDVNAEQLGLAAKSQVREFQIQPRGHKHSELIVKLPAWSDGTPVTATPQRGSMNRH